MISKPWENQAACQEFIERALFIALGGECTQSRLTFEFIAAARSGAGERTVDVARFHTGGFAFRIRTFSEYNGGLVVELVAAYTELSPGNYAAHHVPGLARIQKMSKGGKYSTDYSKLALSWQLGIPWKCASPVDAALLINKFLANIQAEFAMDQRVASQRAKAISVFEQEQRVNTVADTLGLTKLESGRYATPLPYFFVQTDPSNPAKVTLSFEPKAMPVEKLVDLMGDIAEFTMALERVLGGDA